MRVCVFYFLLGHAQAEAINMLMDLRAKISTQEDFAEIAQEHSDCGSARSGGDLGEFGEGQMMKVRCNTFMTTRWIKGPACTYAGFQSKTLYIVYISCVAKG